LYQPFVLTSVDCHSALFSTRPSFTLCPLRSILVSTSTTTLTATTTRRQLTSKHETQRSVKSLAKSTLATLPLLLGQFLLLQLMHLRSGALGTTEFRPLNHLWRAFDGRCGFTLLLSRFFNRLVVFGLETLEECVVVVASACRVWVWRWGVKVVHC
jgi:hypothetical protein